MENTLFDQVFRDSEGKIVLAQMPNLPLIVWILASLLNLFLSGREGDMNIRGAFLHMAADALVSVGVVLAGIAILLTGWLWFDPVISLAIVVISV
ncbi:MAG: cation transporter [Microcoleus sp.]